MDRVDKLSRDPAERLSNSTDEAVRAFARSHLLEDDADIGRTVLGCPEVRRLLASQRIDGSWRAPGKRGDDAHATMVATFKSFRTLVHRYELDRSVREVERAAEHLFSYQTREGDFRGMIGGQYATYYTGEFISLLVKAGYWDDGRVDDGMVWLLGMRQDDGGWTVPLLTLDLGGKEIVQLTSTFSEPLPPDRSRPFSHNWTDMVLRAFAVHPLYRRNREARRAADLLKGSLFLPDAYSSYRDARYWTRFVHWWPNLLTALEILAAMGYARDDEDVARGIAWFIENQRDDGLWDLEEGKPGKPLEREWLSLRICRMLRSYEIR